jgi:hypothetical protein
MDVGIVCCFVCHLHAVRVVMLLQMPASCKQHDLKVHPLCPHPTRRLNASSAFSANANRHQNSFRHKQRQQQQRQQQQQGKWFADAVHQ